MARPSADGRGPMHAPAAHMRPSTGGGRAGGTCARRSERSWMKFSYAQGLENLDAFQASYTASSVRWSPSGWKNLAFFWSACRRRGPVVSGSRSRAQGSAFSGKSLI